MNLWTIQSKIKSSNPENLMNLAVQEAYPQNKLL